MLTQAIKTLWKGLCTVTVREKITDKQTGRTQWQEVNIYTDIPCHLSFSTVRPTGDGIAAATTQDVKLFVGSEVIVPPGSKISVTQNDRTMQYKGSGIPAVYSIHQEICLESFERWA